MGYNGSDTIEVSLEGTYLEDRTNLALLLHNPLLEKYGFTRNPQNISHLHPLDISHLSYTEGGNVIFERKGETVQKAVVIARKPVLERVHQSLLNLLEELKPNGKKTS